MKIIADQELRAVLEGKPQQLKQEIFSAESDYLLNTNEPQYVEYLVSRYRIEPVAINVAVVFVSPREEMIPGERFPNAWESGVERGRSSESDVLRPNRDRLQVVQVGKDRRWLSDE
jgi:hypothetical protein